MRVVKLYEESMIQLPTKIELIISNEEYKIDDIEKSNSTDFFR